MVRALNKRLVLLVAANCLFSGALVGAQPPTPKKKPVTLWRFLGIPQTVHNSYDAVANRGGNHPGLERKKMSPRVTRLADPGNLESENPAIKRAAEIKRQEDLAPQKIKALKYLASIGCGCYEDVAEALLAGLDDCTEKVRLETVEAIAEASKGEACVNCKQRNCCSGAITERLNEMAYKQDESGCWVEPSERVRNAAKAALQYCTPVVDVEREPEELRPPDRPEDESRPADNPDDGTVPPDEPPEINPFADDDGVAVHRRQQLNKHYQRQTVTVSDRDPRVANATTSSRRVYQAEPHQYVNERVRRLHASAAASSASHGRPSPTLSAHDTKDAVADGELGVIQKVDAASRAAAVRFVSQKTYAVGTTLGVYRRIGTGYGKVGELTIVKADKGRATAVALGGTHVRDLIRGDGVIAY